MLSKLLIGGALVAALAVPTTYALVSRDDTVGGGGRNGQARVEREAGNTQAGAGQENGEQARVQSRDCDETCEGRQESNTNQYGWRQMQTEGTAGGTAAQGAAQGRNGNGGGANGDCDGDGPINEEPPQDGTGNQYGRR